MPANPDEAAPILHYMDERGVKHDVLHLEDTPAYRTLLAANLLTTQYRKRSFEDIFEAGVDLKANSSMPDNCMERVKFGICIPGIGCIAYRLTHTELFVPAGSVGLLQDEENRYLFAQPGMHNIRSLWIKHVGTTALPMNNSLQHGNRCILVVSQGFIGIAIDNGQPVLFPPGIHVWTSETLQYQKAVALDQHKIQLGPYTLLTVDEGYAAVTQNNGKQQILPGGYTHLLDHKNWRFEKFLTLKIQSDDLQEIKATSADNITMNVTSTVTWRIVDPTLAATMAAETMAVAGGAVSTDITKLRQDVLKQAIASLASFIGCVNYSDSFHMASQVQGRNESDDSPLDRGSGEAANEAGSRGVDNPLYDPDRMSGSVAHANTTTMSYGIEILSINILTAVPIDKELTKALACGAVASAEALQAETTARGNAKAMNIDAEAFSEKVRTEAVGLADAQVVRARARGEAAQISAEGSKHAGDLLSASRVAVELAKMDRGAMMIGPQDKFYFGQEPAYFAHLVLEGDAGAARAGKVR